MLTYIETMKKINAISGELKALKDKTDFYNHKDLCRSLFQNGKTEELKQIAADYKQNAEKEQTLKRYLTVYKSNAEKLYILENMQTIIDIFNKYQGKKCGEKTKDKIKAEAKENNISMYFSDGIITFFMGLYGYDRIEVYTKYIDGKKQTITDNDNKINCLDLNMFHLPTHEQIIDDVEAYTEQKEAEFLKLKQLYQALEEATKEYNKNCPFKSQYIRDGVLYMD
jgi:hypothetical protein